MDTEHLIKTSPPSTSSPPTFVCPRTRGPMKILKSSRILRDFTPVSTLSPLICVCIGQQSSHAYFAKINAERANVPLGQGQTTEPQRRRGGYAGGRPGYGEVLCEKQYLMNETATLHTGSKLTKSWGTPPGHASGHVVTLPDCLNVPCSIDYFVHNNL